GLGQRQKVCASLRQTLIYAHIHFVRIKRRLIVNEQHCSHGANNPAASVGVELSGDDKALYGLSVKPKKGNGVIPASTHIRHMLALRRGANIAQVVRQSTLTDLEVTTLTQHVSEIVRHHKGALLYCPHT